MIFVSLGTTKFNFDRLLKSLDDAVVELGLREELIIQTRASNCSFNYRNIKTRKEFSIKAMIKLLKKARIIIVHASPVIIFFALRYSKNKPLVLPRLKRFNEHVNDHQYEFSQFFRKKTNNAIFLKENDLKKEIIKYLLKPQKNIIRNNVVSDPAELAAKLMEYTENIK